MRTTAAIAIFLFGTTFLWMTASFAGRTPPPTGVLWTVVNVLSLAAVVAFSATAWAVWKDLSWWEPAALVAAVIGLVAVVPFVLAVRGIEPGLGDMGVQINLWSHALGAVVVLLVARSAPVHQWFVGMVER